MNRLDRRGFLVRTAAGTLAASSAAWRGPGLLRAAPAEADDTVRDRLWLWGHPAGCHTQNRAQWGLPGSSRIAPVEAAAWLGIPNLLMVRYDLEPKPPFGDYARPMRALRRVVWSIEGGGGADVGPVLELRGTLPNLHGVIMDDYFGRVTALAPPQWLAANGAQFPVTLSVSFPQPVAPTTLELTQTSWHSGDYRSRRFAVELSADGTVWQAAGGGELANQAAARAEVRLPGTAFRQLRVRILDTHDKDQALSCGLGAFRLLRDGQELPGAGWEIQASSTYTGHPASDLLKPRAAHDTGPFSLAALTQFRQRLAAGPAPLDVWVVLYTHEFAFGPRLQPHLALCDVVTLWTWQAADLARLEENFARCEQLVGAKRKVLGLYMWDYGTKQPMPLELMRRQCTLGLEWLRAGRIDGMIFLASCICDLDLEAVQWTRQWIAEHRNGYCPRRRTRGG